MAKKDTVRALVQRGIKEYLAEKVAEAESTCVVVGSTAGES